jgi:hypothetical protein
LQNELGGTTTNDSLTPTQKKRKVGQKQAKIQGAKARKKNQKQKAGFVQIGRKVKGRF